MNKGLEKATKHKNMLLEYDKTSAQRTQVIDDESDYFATDSNKWLSKREKQALKKKEEKLRELKHASRLQLKVTLDFAGRQVIDDNECYSGIYDRRTVTSLEEKNSADLVDPTHSRQRPQDIRPMFTSPLSESQASKKSQGVSDVKKNTKNQLRIQDRELMEMSDQGMCLSMHQPWASLLVCGIKRVEGRSWYTAHRGPLWIAATVKTPTTAEISSLENFYRMTYPDDVLDFPQEYPTGCLLGCVEVVDCLEEEEYRRKFPNGESESNYVFIVENPRELKFKFQVKGKHKIWKLEPDVHSAAKKSINHL